MQTPSTLSIWLADQLRPLLLLSAILALILAIVYVSMRIRGARMNERRTGLNEDSFVHSLVIYGFDSGIARTTFRYLQTTQYVPFPIQASDLLDQDLGLDLEDLNQAVRELAALTERLYMPGRRSTPILTVEDLVRFLQASPRLSVLAA